MKQLHRGEFIVRSKLVIVVLASFFIAACSNSTSKENAEKAPRVHGGDATSANAPAEGLVEVVKKQKLLNYQDKTIGQAFGAYQHFSKTEWRETPMPKGKVYIDYIGQNKQGVLDADAIKKGIVATGVEIKFTVLPGGKLFVAMVSKLETKSDGKIYAYPLDDHKRVIDAIYANKVIDF